MKYRVLSIEEDLDFGCEEREENAPIMAVVTLEKEDGEAFIQKFPDRALEEENIQPGDQVFIGENGLLYKVPGND